MYGKNKIIKIYKYCILEYILASLSMLEESDCDITQQFDKKIQLLEMIEYIIDNILPGEIKYFECNIKTW